MTEINRRLQAIAFLDIEGYTGIVQESESEGFEMVSRFENIVKRLAKDFHGKLINFYGDGALLIFKSAVSTAKFAIAVQKEFRSGIRPIPVRVGLHLGDVVEFHDSIYGDGVNLASRLETLAIPGSVVVSEEMRRQLLNQAGIEFKFLGEFQFKNVQIARKAYAMITEGLVVPDMVSSAAKVEKQSKSPVIDFAKKYFFHFLPVAILFLAFITWIIISRSSATPVYSQLPEGIKARVAILAFENRSEAVNDPIGKIVRQGIRDHVSILHDIYWVSLFSLPIEFDPDYIQRKSLKDDGVTHAVQGHYTLEAERFEIYIELIELQTKHVILSKKFPESIRFIDRLPVEIAFSVGEKLHSSYAQNLKTGSDLSQPFDLESARLIAEARSLWAQRGETNLTMALDKLSQAEEVTKSSASLYSLRSVIYATCQSNKWKCDTDSTSLSLDSLIWQNAKLALELDEYNSDAYAALGENANHEKSNFIEAEKYFQKGLKLNEQNSTILQWLAELYLRVGKISGNGEAWDLIKLARLLDPNSLSTQWMEGQLLLARGYKEEFKEKNEAILAKDSSFRRSQQYLWQYYLSKADPINAIDALIPDSSGVKDSVLLALSLLSMDSVPAPHMEKLRHLDYQMLDMLVDVYYDDWAVVLPKVDSIAAREFFFYNYFQTSPFPIFERLKSKPEVTDILKKYNVEVHHIPNQRPDSKQNQK